MNPSHVLDILVYIGGKIIMADFFCRKLLEIGNEALFQLRERVSEKSLIFTEAEKFFFPEDFSAFRKGLVFRAEKNDDGWVVKNIIERGHPR